MTSITSKVCIVGDFAVGKTSVAERFVNNHFSESYLTTVGVKIDTKEIEVPELGVSHKLVIWDIAGSERFGHTEFAYLRGASGYIYVVDGTRASTLRSAMNLQDQINDKLGGAASVVLVNKKDLASDWEVSESNVEALQSRFSQVFKTSAKTGDEVERAFEKLARQILENDMRAD